MSKRTKEVFSSIDHIAHLWANKSQYTARNGRNFFFEGDTIYSYGKHFPIAKHVENSNGDKAVLFTIGSYSNTTARHISAVRGALNDLNLKVFHVTSFDLGEYNLTDYKRRIKDKYDAMISARGRANHYKEEFERLVMEANSYADFIGSNDKIIITDEQKTQCLIAAEKSEKHNKLNTERQSKRQSEYEERRKEQQRILLLEYPEKLKLWYEGKSIPFPLNPNNYFSVGNEPTVIRRLSPTIIETSRGAQIPYNAGKRLFDIIQSVMKSGHCWATGETNIGALPEFKIIKVGSFEVNRIEINGDLRAGCHFIPYTSIKDFATREGWL